MAQAPIQAAPRPVLRALQPATSSPLLTGWRRTFAWVLLAGIAFKLLAGTVVLVVGPARLAALLGLPAPAEPGTPIRLLAQLAVYGVMLVSVVGALRDDRRTAQGAVAFAIVTATLEFQSVAAGTASGALGSILNGVACAAFAWGLLGALVSARGTTTR